MHEKRVCFIACDFKTYRIWAVGVVISKIVKIPDAIEAAGGNPVVPPDLVKVSDEVCDPDRRSLGTISVIAGHILGALSAAFGQGNAISLGILCIGLSLLLGRNAQT